MVEFVTFLTGTFFVYIVIKLILTKIFIDSIIFIGTHKYFLIGLGVGVLAYLFFPPAQEYIKLLVQWFIDSIKALFVLLWDLLSEMIKALIGDYLK